MPSGCKDSRIRKQSLRKVISSFEVILEQILVQRYKTLDTTHIIFEAQDLFLSLSLCKGNLIIIIPYCHRIYNVVILAIVLDIVQLIYLSIYLSIIIPYCHRIYNVVILAIVLDIVQLIYLFIYFPCNNNFTIFTLDLQLNQQ